jgi:hypothetical protein
VDTTRDNLPDSDRDATRTLFEQALIDNGQKVVGTGPDCTQTWRIYAVKLGTSVTATVNGPDDRRTMHVRSVEDLPGAYSQMIKSLLSGTQLSAEGTNVDRTNVTATQTSSNRVAADSVWYIRLGYGGVAADGLNGGPAFGWGWRKELDRIGLDLSFLNFVLTETRNNQFQDFSGSLVRLAVLYYFDPYANNSLYAGGGLGLGWNVVDKDYANYSRFGIQGEVSLGYEMFRASNIRLLVQLDASLPLGMTHRDSIYGYDTYTASTTGSSAPPIGSESLYTPAFSLSLGIGFGKSNTITVRQIQ